MARLRSNAAARASENGDQVIDDASVDNLKQRVATLEEEKRELQQLANYRSKFLSRLAHELRTPLTSIFGFTEILLSHEKLTETQRGFCERIQNSAQQLHASLNQLADLARLEAGRSELLREEFSLADLLSETCAALARRAEKQNVKLHVARAPHLLPLVSDRARLRQIVYNFLAYAIARSPDGASVVATVENDPRGLLLKIDDEGEPLADPDRIETNLASRCSDSSELGLAIAMQNIDLLGATLSFQNRPTCGVQIAIRFPAVARETSRQ